MVLHGSPKFLTLGTVKKVFYLCNFARHVKFKILNNNG